MGRGYVKDEVTFSGVSSVDYLDHDDISRVCKYVKMYQITLNMCVFLLFELYFVKATSQMHRSNLNIPLV